MNENSSHCHEIKRFSLECGEVQKPKEATVRTQAAFDTLFLVLSAPLSLIAMERSQPSSRVSWSPGTTPL